ncbi:MAG: hypothetical protein JCHSAcid_09070 [uncultured Acidilobus sp. JCHS]|jgi:hypothetical protein|nr:MAG: hypothetical protein JCHSAcid_09070 [uncultured Acidilobus sp. JCHS]
MNRIGRLALVAGILAIALAVPMAAANVIFVYQAQVTVKPVTPIVFLAGPDASNVGLSLTNNTSPQISLTIPITNSSETYVYQALEVKVNAVWSGPWYLYVDSCSYSGPALTSVKLIVYPITGSPSSPTGTITITPSTSCTASGTVSLTAGNTYYIDFLVEPTLPISHGAGQGTLTIYFGLTNESAVTVPTS